jgi:hypothetical protein
LGWNTLGLTPILIESYYPQAAPVAVAARWIVDKSWRGFTTATFFVALYPLFSVLNDARVYLAGLYRARRNAGRGPIALENGTPSSSPPTRSASTAESKFMDRTGPKVSTFFSCAFFFSRAEVVVLERPLRENLTVLAVFLLRGLVILCIVFLALFLVLLVVELVKQRSRTGRSRSRTDDALPEVATQTSTSPAEVLIELDEEISPDLPVVAEGGR